MRSIEGAIRGFVKGKGKKPSKEVLMSLANNETDNLINTFFSAINEELDTFVGLPHQEEICELLKDIYMIIGVSNNVDRKLLTYRLNRLDLKLENLSKDSHKRFKDPEAVKASFDKIKKEIEFLKGQAQEKESNRYDFMRYLIGEVRNIKYLEYTLNKFPNLVNAKDKAGNSIFQNVVRKLVFSIIGDVEQDKLYFGSVTSLLLSSKKLHLTEQDKGKIINEIYHIINDNPKMHWDHHSQKEVKGLVGRIRDNDEHQTRLEKVSNKYNISIVFPTPVLEQVKLKKNPYSYQNTKDRITVDDYVITIDKEGAIEIDDALSCKKLPNGNYLYGIHNATALGYFPYSSPTIEEALTRTRSIYLPRKYQNKEDNFNRVIPMFPYEFSAQKGSLIEGVPRLARSYYFEITPEGEIVQEKFYKSIITSKKKTSYREIDKILSHGSKDKELQQLVQNLQGVTEALDKRYKPNAWYEQIKEDSDDFSALRVKNYGAEKIVYYAMMLTGNRVATFFDEAGYPCLYRVLKIEEDAAQKLQELIDRITKTDDGEQYRKLYQLVKGMYPKGMYATEGSHDGLGLDHYCHITSTLRRGADIVVEHALEECYDKEPSDKELYRLQAEIEKRAREINAKQDPIEWFVRDYKRAYQKRR